MDKWVGDLYKIVSEYDQELLKLNLDYTCDHISSKKVKDGIQLSPYLIQRLLKTNAIILYSLYEFSNFSAICLFQTSVTKISNHMLKCGTIFIQQSPNVIVTNALFSLFVV